MAENDDKDTKKNDTSTQDDKNSDNSSGENQNKSDNKNDDVSIPKHRFDEVNEQLKETKKQLEKIQADQKNKQEEDLKQQNKFRELYESAKQENEKLQSQIKLGKKETLVRTEASKLGVRDDAIEDLTRLINLDEVEVSEDGSSNAKTLLEGFLTNKTYLLSEEGKKNIGTSTSSDGGESKTGKLWKFSEIQSQSKDFKWHEEHKEEIEKAKAEGRIDYDA